MWETRREINHSNIASAVLRRRKATVGRQRKEVINFDRGTGSGASLGKIL